jgi:DNA-binding NtrC family response regulator
MLVLVVEDEALLNFVTSEELMLAGHEMLSAYNADEAIKILEQRNDIRVVFTDIDLPGSLDGLKLAAAVRDRWPPIHLIVTSGKQPKRALPSDATFVAKPYRLSHLQEIIAAF